MQNRNEQSPKSPEIRRNQGRLISNLNKYLESQDLPIRMEPEGICRGLAVMRCKYILENREDEYYAMLDKISDFNNLKGENDDEVNHFVVQTLIAFKPDLFDSTKKQKDALSNIAVGGKPLNASLQISLITTDEKWIAAINNIDLQTDEVMLLGSPTHAFSASRTKDGKGYRLADPNSREGYVDYPDAKSLVAALRKVAEASRFIGELALDVEIVRKPDAGERAVPLPNAKQLFDSYRDSKAKCIKEGTKIAWNELSFACRNDGNIDIVKSLCAKESSVTNMLTGMSIANGYDNSEIVKYMLDNSKTLGLKGMLNNADIQKVLIETAILKGSYKCFNLLIDHNETKQYYLAQALSKEQASTIINIAAGAANPDILKTLLNDYTERATPLLTANELAQIILAKQKTPGSTEKLDAIETAIGKKGKCGLSNTECVTMLLNQVQTSNQKLSDKQLFHYTLLAVKTNQPHLVTLLTDTISKELPKKHQKHLFDSIHLSVETAKHTDYSVLLALEKAGVNHSFQVRGVMKEKSGRSPGVLLSIGIALAKFTDWVKGIDQKESLKHCEEKFKELKQNFKAERAARLIEEPELPSNTEPFEP